MTIKYLKEPELLFGAGQSAVDPRDGLVLFGPYQPLSPATLRAGLVGLGSARSSYANFVTALQKPILSSKRVYGLIKTDDVARPSFPGFEAVFGVKWPSNPEWFSEINETKLNLLVREPNVKKRTNALVDLFLTSIVATTQSEDVKLDLWFVVVPRSVYKACKPNSSGKSISQATKNYVELTKAGQMTFGFDGENYIEEIENLIDSSNDFHHLLKAKLIHEKINVPIQIIVENTLNFRDKNTNKPFEESIKAHLAWTQSTTLFYKLGKLPWKLHQIREGVCYLGIIFKKVSKDGEQASVCSAAQMFLTDGDGSVFRGNTGLWETREHEYHLNGESAESLVGKALDDYKAKWGKYPDELFIHGRNYFSDEEWNGFSNSGKVRGAVTKIVGVTIKSTNALKLYREAPGQTSNYGVMRGLAVKISETEGYVVTRGFIPRLNTSSALEIPNPLHIAVSRGDSSIDVVMRDVLALTKLNYNACIYGDGLPVTLRFSNIIGDILTATKQWQSEQRQFRFYI